MKILALESSAKSVSTAVVEDGAVLAGSCQHIALTHSETLLPLIEAMLRNARLSLADMDAFAVAVGPGSFTGLRIGVAALKGLAWAQDKPCIAVSTLEAMAYNSAVHNGLLLAAMDARRGQIYHARFAVCDGSVERLCPDMAIALSELAQQLSTDSAQERIVVGDGAELCASYLQEQGIACTLAPMRVRRQDAVGVGLAAQSYAARGEFCTARELLPVYLRQSQAERERAARLLSQEIV